MPESKSISFSKEEAVRLVIAGVESGALGFPFSKAFTTDGFHKRVKDGLDNARMRGRDIDDNVLREHESYEIATAYATLARRDALFFLALVNALVTGITETEADSIFRDVFSHKS